MPVPVSPASTKTAALILFVLVLLVSGIYWQAGNFAFISLDDHQYVLGAPPVMKGMTAEGFSWALTSHATGNWHPLTWLSHMVDVELFGPAPGWHHRVNVLFHLLNTGLLFFVLWRMTGGVWESAVVAALFGVHPLHVESVAWVSERKDVLSTFFWILTLGAYLRYARKPGVGRYLVVAAALALGLMAKPMVVTLPFVLLLLDWWPLGRFAGTAGYRIPGIAGAPFLRLAGEKVPLLVLSAATGFATILAQSGNGAVKPLESWDRVSNALVSWAAYLLKTAWPSGLAVFYPHPSTLHAVRPVWQVAGATLLLGALSFVAWRERHRRPYLAVGWLWYLGTLVPVIGLVQVGGAALADRYTYVPLIGLFIAGVWGVSGTLDTRRFRRLALGTAGGVVAVLSVAAWVQAGYWRDSATLFSRALQVTESNWLAMGCMGFDLEERGEYAKSVPVFLDALRIKPDYGEASCGLGLAYSRLGRYLDAIPRYRDALRTRPDYLQAWSGLGLAYFRLDRYRDAIPCYLEALRIQPDAFDVLNNLAVAYDELGEYRRAIPCYREVLRIEPGNAAAWGNLGMCYEDLGELREAIACVEAVLRITPGDPEAERRLSRLRGKAGTR